MTEPWEHPEQLLTALRSATVLVVEHGDAYDTYPYTERPALLEVRDAEAVQGLVRELAAAEVTAGVVLPTLTGLTLTFRDEDEDHLGSVGVLTARWLRHTWSSDGLLREPLSLLADASIEWHQYLQPGRQAAGAITPVHAAATDADGLEHAIGDASTLCGLPASRVQVVGRNFDFGAGACPDCDRTAWEQRDPGTWPTAFEDRETLSEAWEDRWGATPPAADLLRGGGRWVRFHSLPGSKRYAETPDEYDEILRRHHSVLGDLAAATGSSEVLVVTLSWSRSCLPVPQAAPLRAAVPDAAYWSSFQEPGYESNGWNHAWVSRASLVPEALDPLLRLVADWGAVGVILFDQQLTWFYHPYDGGADVILPTPEQRDALKERYADWLPTNDSGL